MEQRGPQGKLHPAAEGLQLAHQLFIFLPVHHMGGLYRHMGKALFLQPGHGLGHIVNGQTVPHAQLFQDHAAGKGPPDLPAGESPGNVFFRCQNGFFQGVLVGSSKGDHQNRFFHALFLSSAADKNGQPKAAR